MKKVLIILGIITSITSSIAQSTKINAGVDLGIVMGELSDYYSTNFAFGVSYLQKINNKLNVGGTSGYEYFQGKKTTLTVGTVVFPINVKSVSFIPLAGSVEYQLYQKMYAGLDLGYAIGIAPNGVKGGVLYEPRIGYTSKKFDTVFSYKRISQSNGGIGSLNIGVSFNINKLKK